MFKNFKNKFETKPVLEIANRTAREFIATFGLVFTITFIMWMSYSGTIEKNGELEEIIPALKIHEFTKYIMFGLLYGVGFFIFRADMNPSLTLAKWVRGLVGLKELLIRLVAQLSAGLLAFLFIIQLGGVQEMLMYKVDELTAIDIILLEGVFISIIVIILYSDYNNAYKPLGLATSYALILILFGGVINAKLNFLFVIVPSIIFNMWGWQITFFMIAHLLAIFLVVILWIKDSWSD